MLVGVPELTYFGIEPNDLPLKVFYGLLLILDILKHIGLMRHQCSLLGILRIMLVGYRVHEIYFGTSFGENCHFQVFLSGFFEGGPVGLGFRPASDLQVDLLGGFLGFGILIMLNSLEIEARYYG